MHRQIIRSLVVSALALSIGCGAAEHRSGARAPLPDVAASMEVPVLDRQGRTVDRIRYSATDPAAQAPGRGPTDLARSDIVYHDVDRLLYRSGAQFAALTAGSQGAKHTIRTDGLVVQNSRTQAGLHLRLAGRRDLTATFEKDGIRLGAGPGQTAPLLLATYAVLGDPTLALQTDTPSPAGTAAAEAPAEAAPAGPPGSAGLSPDVDELARSVRRTDAERRERVFELFANSRRAFRPLRGDPREANVRVGILADRDGDSFFDFGVGSDLGLYRRSWREDDNLTFSVRGHIHTRLQLNAESTMQLNNDVTGGLALGYARDVHEVELYLYHVSGHLGDEAVAFGHRRWRNYAHESVRFLYGRQLGNWRLYGGPTVALFGDDIAVRDRVILQAGAEVDFDVRKLPLYAALDLQGRQQRGFRPNVTTTLGVKLGDQSKIDNPMRLYLEFFDGYSNMGQYWQDRQQYIMGGFGYDF